MTPEQELAALRLALVKVTGLAEYLRDSLINACEGFEGEDQITDEELEEWKETISKANALIKPPCQHDFEAKAQDGGALSMSQPVIYLCSKCGEPEET